MYILLLEIHSFRYSFVFFMALRSIIFNSFFVLWTVVWGGSGLVALLFRGKTKTKISCFVGYIWAAALIHALRIICRIDWQLNDPNNALANNQPCIIACKHQSVWETMFFLYHLNNPVYVIKQELTRVPIYGWHLQSMGMVAVNRSKGIAALKLMNAKINTTLSSGRSVVIFPEGTRVGLNEESQIKSGVASLYSAFADKYPIIPISLDSGKYWRHRSWQKYPGTIQIIVESPLQNNLKKSEVLGAINEKINLCGN